MVSKTERCFGCAACASVCPRDAIRMKADQDGFLYPEVQKDVCIGCDLCDQVCPLNKEANAAFMPRAYAVQHNSPEVLRESASGGMYTALSDAILAEGGVVYGAAFDQDLCIVHIRAETKQERDRCRGSKYVQSNLADVFRWVRKDLKAGRKVLFTGTPCQVDGLKAFLRTENDNLFLCDLICNGVTSPLIWKEHLQKLEKVNHSKVVQYKFRPKDWGWTVHNEKAVLKNGKTRHSDAYSALYRELYYSRLVHRPSCYQCKYTNLNRVSDITIADCRGIEHRETAIDFEAGVSLVLVNTAKGAELFSRIQMDVCSEELDIREFMQPPLTAPAKKAKSRERFWREFHSKGYWAAIKAVYGKYYVAKFTVKKLLKKCGILPQ